MIRSVYQHQNGKHLSGNIVELPEKPSVGHCGCYFFDVLKDVAIGTVLDGKKDTREETDDQRREPYSGQIKGKFFINL